MNKAGNYVMAALPSLVQHCNGVLKQHQGYLNNDSINKFLLENCDKFLSSIGVCLTKGKPPTEKILEKYSKVLDRFEEAEYLKDCEVIIDSAGYQLQSNYMKKQEIPTFIDIYHKFLENSSHRFDRAFMLDVAPGATHCPFDSWQEMEQLNRLSYGKSAELPKNIRDKMIYIHHFRTPSIKKVYDKLLNEGYADGFQHFATGGLVSFSKSSSTTPIILYSIPLIDVILHAKKVGMKKFKWHCLGGSEFKDILFHKLAEIHIKKIHDIDVEITYDSSTIFKTLAMSRYIYVPLENESIWKMSIRSDNIHMPWKQKGTVEEYFYTLLNEVADKYGFKSLNSKDNPIYNNEGKLSRVSYMYGIIHQLQMFNICDKWCKDTAKDIYSEYVTGQTKNFAGQFDNKIEKTMFNFNNGITSNRLSARTPSVYKSLEFLRNLDLKECNHYVTNFMAGDECEQLVGHKICTF